ncbi:MAG: type IV pilus assembly protein PilM [Syntrophales bacterium]|jgi:type IV pilus assembly protein PilM
MVDLKSLILGKKQFVGLDVGSSSVKLAEILDTPRGYILDRFFQVSLPKGIIVDGALVKENDLTAVIKNLYAMANCKRRKIVTSLSGHSVIVKKVTLPTMDTSELRELIRDEASKYLPFNNMDDVYYDIQILGENEFNPTQVDILLAAAKKDITESYIQAIERAGLPVSIVDVDNFALQTMLEENYEFNEDDSVAIVNIGASITNINVIHKGATVFNRDVILGGNTVSETLQAKLGVTFEEAEKIKIAGPPAGDEAAVVAFKEDLLTLTEPILAEIERSFDFFRSISGVRDLKQVFLSGGCAKIPGFAEGISRRIGITTEIVNPFKKIAYNTKVMTSQQIAEIGSIAAVAVGLALRREGDK